MACCKSKFKSVHSELTKFGGPYEAVAAAWWWRRRRVGRSGRSGESGGQGGSALDAGMDQDLQSLLHLFGWGAAAWVELPARRHDQIVLRRHRARHLAPRGRGGGPEREWGGRWRWRWRWTQTVIATSSERGRRRRRTRASASRRGEARPKISGQSTAPHRSRRQRGWGDEEGVREWGGGAAEGWRDGVGVRIISEHIKI